MMEIDLQLWLSGDVHVISSQGVACDIGVAILAQVHPSALWDSLVTAWYV